MKTILPILLAITFAACSVTSHNIDISKLHQVRVAPTNPPNPQTAQQQLDEQFNAALLSCKQVLTSYQTQATTYQYINVALIAIGSVAGSIGVPLLAANVANKLWTTTMGSISGLTNAVQSDFASQGLTSANELSIRTGIITNINNYVEQYAQTCPSKYNSSTDFTDWFTCESGTISQIEASCISYAISDPNITLNTTISQ